MTADPKNTAPVDPLKCSQGHDLCACEHCVELHAFAIPAASGPCKECCCRRFTPAPVEQATVRRIVKEMRDRGQPWSSRAPTLLDVNRWADELASLIPAKDGE
jgi:hypothetical protein